MAKTLQDIFNRNEKLEAAPQTTLQRLFGKLPQSIQEPVRSVGTTIRDGLFGNPRARVELMELEKRGHPTKKSTEGILPILGRDTTSQFLDLANKLEAKGTAPERAAEISMRDVMNRGRLPVQLPGQPERQKQLDDLTKPEKRTAQLSRLGQAGGSILDVASVIPAGFISRKGAPIAGKALTDLVKTTKVSDVKKILRQSGIEVRKAEAVAGRVAKSTKLDEVARILEGGGITTAQARATGPTAEMVAEARRYNSAQEFAKAKTDPLHEFKTLDTIKDRDIARGTVKEAISDIGGLRNVHRGTMKVEEIVPTETINLGSSRAQLVQSEIDRGIITPIIVDDAYQIMDGNHRYAIYKAIGMRDIPVIAPKDVPIQTQTAAELKQIWNQAMGAAPKKAPPESDPARFEGLQGLSTRLLESFRGEPETVKRGRFLELFNKAKKQGIRKADEDLIMEMANRQEGNTVNLNRLAKDVQAELLPLTPTPVKTPRYSYVGAPFIDKGKYGEVIYQSPVKTTAGDIHFPYRGHSSVNNYAAVKDDSFPNYFSHVRYEDMVDGKTRKILETQSDLMQKDNFAREAQHLGTVGYQHSTGGASPFWSTSLLVDKKPNQVDIGDIVKLRNPKTGEVVERKIVYMSNDKSFITTIGKGEVNPLGRLRAYEADTNAHLRTFREEIKRAAQDGKDTVLIPDGRTAMRIEGIGNYDGGWRVVTQFGDEVPLLRTDGSNMKVGMQVRGQGRDDWIITDVLGNGRFNAIPKRYANIIEAKFKKDINQIMKTADNDFRIEELSGFVETFDISGRIDTNHFVYRLNEKDLPREARRLGLDVVGNKKVGEGTYWEIKVPPRMANQPTEAFGAMAGIQVDDEGELQFDPAMGALGFAGMAAARRGKGSTGGGMKRINELMPSAEDLLKATGGKTGAPGRPERRFVTRVGQMDSKTRKFLDGDYNVRSTDELIKIADDVIANDYDAAIRIAKEGGDDKAVAIASRLIDTLVTDARKAKGASKNKLYEEAADIANDAARTLTEHGRAIQAAAILGRLTPEGMVRYTARIIQKHNDRVSRPPIKRMGDIFNPEVQARAGKRVPELTGEQASDITEMMENVIKIDDPAKKAEEMMKLDKYIKDLLPSSLYRKISTIWKAGLLTGPPTHGLNLFSNLTHAITEVVKDAPAAMVDAVVSLFTGKRTLAFTLRGAPEGVKQGAKKGWHYWKTGFDERDVGKKLDYRHVNFGSGKIGKAIQTYTESVFRALGTMDQPFYYGAKLRSITSQAIAQAKNEKLTGKALQTRVQQLINNPTETMQQYALLDAETAVFLNKTVLGGIGQSIARAPGGEFILPFVRTPAAVATQVWNYSPAGIVTATLRAIKQGKQFDQRQFSQQMGRGVVGTIASMWIGKELYEADRITLAWPTSQKERKLWELEGKRPNMIRWGGKWRNVATLGPIGVSVVVGAHMQNAYEKTGSPMGAVVSLATGIGSAMTEQSFLQGLNQALDAIKDPERSFHGWWTNFVGSFVPTIFANFARGIDTVERRTSGPLERIQSRVPGIRTGLEPRITTLGDPMLSGGFFNAMLDATRPGIPGGDLNDPVIVELKRLSERGYYATPTMLGSRDGYEGLTPQENTFLWETAGRYAKNAIKEVMNRPAYNNLDDEQRWKMINSAVGDSKDEARARTLLRVTRGMSRPDEQEKIDELRDAGMATNDVVGRYQALKRQGE